MLFFPKRDREIQFLFIFWIRFDVYILIFHYNFNLLFSIYLCTFDSFIRFFYITT